MSILPSVEANSILATSGGAVNAYIPPESFTMGCTYTVLPNDCTARILPSQINAIVSEMIALMAAFNPEGEFDCNLNTNLATNFDTFSAELSASLTNLFDRVTTLEGSGGSSLKYARSTGVNGSQTISQDANARVTDWVTPVITGGVTYSAGVFTVTEEGIWSISAYVNSNQFSIRELLTIVVNGSVVAGNDSRYTSNRQQVQSASTVLALIVGDQVEVRWDVSSESGGTFTLINGRFSMVKLGNT